MKFKITNKSPLIFMFVIIMAVILTCPMSGKIALGAEYDGVNFDDLWYYGEDTLDFAGAKSVVANWNKSKLSTKIIAVIDTGIDASHEIFDSVLYTDKNGNAVGYDARTDQEVPASSLGDYSANKHGNSIAGVIAMFIKELGLQDYIKIYPMKANSVNSNGTNLDTINIDYTVNALNKAKELGADVVNMSFGRLKSDNGTRWAEDKNLIGALYAVNEKAFVVAAAGNDEKDSVKEEDVFYPAGIDCVYSVMSLDRDGKITSNYGAEYDIAAPGKGIYTAYRPEGTKYHYMDGASLATPIASFAGALVQLRYEAEGKAQLNGMAVARLMRNLNATTVKQGNYTIKCLDLNTVLTQDFENTNFNYYPPTEIEIVHDGVMGSGEDSNTILMHATSVKPVNFTAKLSPYGLTDPDIDASVKWYIRIRTYNQDAEWVETIPMGYYGLKLTYTPQIYGEYSIVAMLQYGDEVFEAEQKLKIEYAPYLVGEVRVTYAENANDGVHKAPSSGVLYTTETTVFSLTGIRFVDKTVPIKWFVDDVLCGEGETFAYTPTKAGTHRISAQYGDHPRINTTYVFTAEVKPFIARPLDLSMLVIALAVIVMAGCIILSIAIKKKKAKAVVSTETADKADNTND